MKTKTLVLAMGLAMGTAAMAGPPAHSNAKELRMQHDGHALILDKDLDVYVVEDRDGVYFVDGTFYTNVDGSWQMTTTLDDDDWQIVEVKSVPKALVKVERTDRVAMGPPDHAPAHGYRMQHEGIDLVFDDQRQVYIVEERDGIYFHDGAFYTVEDGEWLRTFELTDEPEWEIVEIQTGILPEELITLETPDLVIDLDIG